MVGVTGRRRGGRSELLRRFGPLPGLAVAVLLVVTVLPSALNLPQSNPTTTPEFAPVPPQDQKNPPPVNAGNFAGVGLTSTGGIGDTGVTAPASPAVGGPGLPPPPPPAALGKTPSTKLCVGNPPRQAEDPLSPPCVAYFQGDNGGATYGGVTRSEVRLLFRYGGGGSCVGCSSQASEKYPTDALFNLCDPATGSEDLRRRVLRVWQAYFNARYQTYNRRVCMWVYFGPGGTNTDEMLRAQAANVFTKVHPFANVGGADAWGVALAERGVLSFSGVDDTSLYKRYPGLFWSYDPSVQQAAESWWSDLWQKVAGQPRSVARDAPLLHPTRQ